MGAVINISVMEDNSLQRGVLNIEKNILSYKSIKPTLLSLELRANPYNKICFSVFIYKTPVQLLLENKLLLILKIWRLLPFESYSFMTDWGKLGEKNDRHLTGGDVSKTNVNSQIQKTTEIGWIH
jgi:hypothetical protein